MLAGSFWVIFLKNIYLKNFIWPKKLRKKETQQPWGEIINKYGNPTADISRDPKNVGSVLMDFAF